MEKGERFFCGHFIVIVQSSVSLILSQRHLYGMSLYISPKRDSKIFCKTKLILPMHNITFWILFKNPTANAR